MQAMVNAATAPEPGPPHSPSLPAPASGDRLHLQLPGFGRLTAMVAGQGAPLLLVHSINASGSAAEVRPLHDHFSASHTVFSIDLPGYGLSDRPDIAYTPRLMTDALHALVGQVQARCGPAPVAAMALSLSCEFLARAAVESPASFSRLALVSPTGFSGRRSWRGPPGSTRGLPWLYRLLRGPGGRWGAPLFRQLTRPGVIRYFLERTWGAKQIDEALWQYDLLTTRQPGAEFAPLHFLAANLFSADIHNVYEALALPVWMSHGVRGDFTDYRSQALVAHKPNWQFSVYQTGALPYFEQPQAFCQDFAAFLASARI
jgi:pimeloyl-ACP methyl ester carboxylesterase